MSEVAMSSDVPVDLSDPRTQVLLAVADDELVIGHRHLHWTGVAPSLEEDLAFSTLGQDEINHADVWYQVLVGGDSYASGAGDADLRDTVDAVGLGRRPEEYRHAILCERPPGDFAYTLARHFLYDCFDDVRLEALTGSTDPDIAAVAGKLLHEERYHLLHAVEWVERIGRRGGTVAERLRSGFAATWTDALGLFEPVPDEQAAVAAGVLPGSWVELVHPWAERLRPVLEHSGYTELLDGLDRAAHGGWVLPAGALVEPGGRHGRHGPEWTTDAWVEMTALYRSEPDTRW